MYATYALGEISRWASGEIESVWWLADSRAATMLTRDISLAKTYKSLKEAERVMTTHILIHPDWLSRLKLFGMLPGNDWRLLEERS